MTYAPIGSIKKRYHVNPFWWRDDLSFFALFYCDNVFDLLRKIRDAPLALGSHRLRSIESAESWSLKTAYVLEYDWGSLVLDFELTCNSLFKRAGSLGGDVVISGLLSPVDEAGGKSAFFELFDILTKDETAYVRIDRYMIEVVRLGSRAPGYENHAEKVLVSETPYHDETTGERLVSDLGLQIERHFGCAVEVQWAEDLKRERDLYRAYYASLGPPRGPEPGEEGPPTFEGGDPLTLFPGKVRPHD